MRRGVGVGRSVAQQRASSAFKDKAEELQESNVEHAKRSVEAFRGHLEEFAAKHRDQIASDPEFRGAFAAMCELMQKLCIKLPTYALCCCVDIRRLHWN